MTILRSFGRALASNPVPVLRHLGPAMQQEADDLVHEIRRLFSGGERRKLIEIVCDSVRKMDVVVGRYNDNMSTEDMDADQKILLSQDQRWRLVHMMCFEKDNHLRVAT